MATKPKNDLISLSQAARLYGFTPDYLRQLVLRRRLQGSKLGSQWVTSAHDMEAFIRSRKPTGVFKKRVKVGAKKR